jgi:hypothetical protein
MSMKKSSDTIGNRTRDLPVCSAVPQPLRHRVPLFRPLRLAFLRNVLAFKCCIECVLCCCDVCSVVNKTDTAEVISLFITVCEFQNCTVELYYVL